MLISQELNPVFQTLPAERMKPSYGFTSTDAVLNVFKMKGWNEVSQAFGRPRKKENIGFQKHIVRLEHPDFTNIEGLSDNNLSKPQLVLVNSHNGSSSFQVFWGLIRIACLNGIISGSAVNGIKLYHTKSIIENLPEKLEYIIAQYPTFINQIKLLQNASFSEPALQEFITRVYSERLKNTPNIVKIDFSVPNTRRHEDGASDAYTVLNKVQEIVMRGGIDYTTLREGEGERLVHTRKLNSVNQQLKLNKFIYNTALELAA